MYNISFCNVTNIFISNFQQTLPNHCYGLNVYALPNAYTEIPPTNVMVLGSVAIGR